MPPLRAGAVSLPWLTFGPRSPPTASEAHPLARGCSLGGARLREERPSRLDTERARDPGCHATFPRRNVVFMGMGEPADNVEHVAGALHAMTHPFGFALGKKYVCVSTVGPSPEHIRALEPLPARLAWSVHAADDKLRKLLVPTTRHTMAELRDAWGVYTWIYITCICICVCACSMAELRDASGERRPALTPRSGGCNPLARGLQPHAPRLQPHVAGEVLEARRDRGLMAEVTLIDGVNDGAEHAEELHALLAPLPGTSRTMQPHPALQPHAYYAPRLQTQPRVSGKTRINLIPYNANAGLGAAGRLFLPSPPEAVQAFHARLIELGVICTVRVPRGNEEDSACGMLRVTKGGSVNK